MDEDYTIIRKSLSEAILSTTHIAKIHRFDSCQNDKNNGDVTITKIHMNLIVNIWMDNPA